MEGKGMSRAAQKKRKRENKQKKQFALKEVVVKDEEQESEEEPMAASDDEIEHLQIAKIPKIDESILFSKVFNHQLSLEKFSGLTLQEIFNLRDVQDVTAHQRSSLILSSFLRPVVLENFYEDIWQKKFYRFGNENNQRNKIGLTKLSNKKKIKKIVTENILRIDEDVRILESNSSDPSISMDGLPESSQDFFRYFLKGKTIVLLQPQKYEDSLWKLYSMLEYEFNSRVDGNLILQPENTTYFETTYDADRFLIQLEGKSSLRYPSTPSDLSAFLSTGTENDDTEESALNKTELESNDVLYVPQGFPIEINSDPSTFSLTLLISTNRKNAVADLLHFTVPTAIGNLKPQLSFLNMSLPTDTRSFLGVAACEDDENPKRKAFCSLLQKSLDAIAKEVIDIIDPAVDQMGKTFIMERLPVPLSKEEELLSSHSSPNAIIHSYTQLRVVRPGVAITVVEDGKCVVYHCVDNSRELFGNPINPLEFDLDDGPAIEALLSAYPHSVTVSDLEHPSDELDDKIGVAQALYKEGILLITDVASRPEGYESETNESDENGIL